MNDKKRGEVLIVTDNEYSNLVNLSSLLEKLNIRSTVTATPLAHLWSELEPDSRLVLTESLPPYTDSGLCQTITPKTCPISWVKLCQCACVAPVCSIGCKSLELEKAALHAGLNGVFYCNDSTEHLLKGIDAILRGELWFRRSVLSDVLCKILTRLDVDSVHGVSADTESSEQIILSRREKEVLKLLCSGATNQEIAMLLHISLHTVKFHIYRIYKKTVSRNRVEAINWAKRNGFSDNSIAERGAF